MNILPYTICVSPFVIEDLRERLGRARWPDEIAGQGWKYGTNLDYLRDLCTHWGHGFDWKEQEDLLNGFHHFLAGVNGFNLHFIHEKGKGSWRIPILLLHGWPDSFARFLKLIPLLTAEGPDGGISFDVIVPSYPGFAFSDKPAHPGMDQAKTALLLAGLMKALGYKQFLVHGGDLGSGVAEQLAIQFPDRVMGMHLTDVPFQHFLSLKPEELSPAEKTWMQAGQKWQMEESAYAMEMSTKPQTLAYALNDSPIGLAGWIIEKFNAWTDGKLESVYTRDELLTNLTIYWVTQSGGSAARMYYEMTHHSWPEGKKSDIPTAFYICPKDNVPAPREFAERVFNVKRWTEAPRGGHFAAMEQPNELAVDIFRFAESYAAQPAGV